MKKRLHDKRAGIAVLISLIIISLAEIVFRSIALGKAVLETSNAGEQVAVIVFALIIMVLTVKGKDRICYICYGAWAGYFVLDQFLELPGVVSEALSMIADSGSILSVGNAAVAVRILSMCCIVAIGVFLIEYMDDGTICNKAFNAVCIATIFLIWVNIATSFLVAVIGGMPMLLLETFNGLYRITMVFMFTFFAYDSAKHQLKKANLSK